MDGTLCDSEPFINEAAVAMFRERGVPAQPEDFRPFIGMGEIRYLGGVAEKYGVTCDVIEAKRRTYEIYLELIPGRLQPYPGALEALERLRCAGLILALGSSADRIKVTANLRECGLDKPGLFAAIVSGDDVERKKPHPDIFLRAAADLKLAPAQCAVVEDAPGGVEAALRAGMRCVAVAQTHAARELGGAHRIIARIGELLPGDFADLMPPG